MKMESTRKELGVTDNFIETALDAADEMVKRLGSKVGMEVYHLIHLYFQAMEDKEIRDVYAAAVKSVTGDHFLTGVCANEVHLRRVRKYKNSIIFAATEVAFHNSLVKKITGKCFLSRPYDTKSVKECEEMMKDFMVYATEIAVSMNPEKKQAAQTYRIGGVA